MPRFSASEDEFYQDFIDAECVDIQPSKPVIASKLTVRSELPEESPPKTHTLDGKTLWFGMLMGMVLAAIIMSC